MNLLFICSQNRWRSLTAEHIFDSKQNINVRSVGTEKNARRKVQATDIHWADVIYVMEKKHVRTIKAKFADLLESKKVINLRIPDKYQYMDTRLVKILEEKVFEARMGFEPTN